MTRIRLLSPPLLLALSGCAASLELQDAAADPAWQGREPERVMVVGLDERRYRGQFERTFVDALRRFGFNAVVGASYAAALRDFDDPGTFAAIMASSRADSLLTVRAVGFGQPNNDVWSVAYAPAALFADGSRGFRQTRGRTMAGAVPGNTAAPYYGLEVQFFDVAADRMVWTARTPIFEGGDMDKLVVEYAELAIGDLTARGVIRP